MSLLSHAEDLWGLMGTDPVRTIKAGDWDAVAYNVGTLAGGLAAGSQVGRSMVKGITGSESRAPSGWNLYERAQYEWDNRFRWDYPDGSLRKWLGSAPTPMSGGVALGFSAFGVGDKWAKKGNCR